MYSSEGDGPDVDVDVVAEAGAEDEPEGVPYGNMSGGTVLRGAYVAGA